MFYVLNTKDEIRNNDPYKVALKSLVNEIKGMDFTTMESIKDVFGDTSMDLLVSWVINNREEVTVKSLEKKLKVICKEFSVEELYYMYISSLSDVLTDEFMIESARNQGIDIKSEFAGYEEALTNLRLKSLIGTFCIYGLIIKEQLLEKNFESINIENDHNATRIIRSLRKGNYSIYKGIRGIPIIMSQKEAQLISGLVNKLINNRYDKKVIEYAGVMYSYRSLEILVSKYCFGNKVNEYVDLREFTGKEAFSISETKLFLSPVQVFTSRRIIPPEEGVVLIVDNQSNVESIYLSECSRFNYRMIFGVVRYKNGLECPISLRMNYNSTVTLSCYEVVDVMSIILDYYKIPEEALKCLGGIPSVPKYDVISGKYWLLRKNGYETNLEKEQRESGKKVKREYTVKTGTYVRKIKGVASNEANEFAKKLRIVLDEGTTLIKEKDRQYFREIEEFGLE